MTDHDYFPGEHVLWDANGTIRFGIIAETTEDDIGELVVVASDAEHYAIGIEGVIGPAGGFWCSECGRKLYTSLCVIAEDGGAQLFECADCDAVGLRYFRFGEDVDERSGCLQPPTEDLVGESTKSLPQRVRP